MRLATFCSSQLAVLDNLCCGLAKKKFKKGVVSKSEAMYNKIWLGVVKRVLGEVETRDRMFEYCIQFSEILQRLLTLCGKGMKCFALGRETQRMCLWVVNEILQVSEKKSGESLDRP
tara:strand:+ start:236 stop:586 length:351 start_codon:yes stop_codon:yes gene_type:complete